MKTAESPKNKLKLFEIALLAGLAVFLASGGLALRAQAQLADRVVRLHVLANSDGEEDQALKLLVRDRVLARATELLTRAGDRTEAESLLRAALPELEALAARELRANGCDYPVTAELTDTEFPTREYDGFTLPAGEYLALRVVIGEGAGRNWWCVVFPPLCTAASADVPAAALAAGLTEEQVGLITEEDRGYVLKFKAVEWWEEIRARLEGGEN
nr:stage II sporulation protein R [uncultured Oscillibacter sp.]